VPAHQSAKFQRRWPDDPLVYAHRRRDRESGRIGPKCRARISRTKALGDAEAEFEHS
jgi:hypothetical protein